MCTPNIFTREELDAAYAQMTVFSDVLSQVFFKDSLEVTSHILRIILDKPDLAVSEIAIQSPIENPFGHSVRFDVLASDSAGRFYDIEIQSSDAGDLLWRADYYGAAIKMKHLKKRDQYRSMPTVYVIFIVKNGQCCDNRPINRLLMRDDAQRIYEVGTRIYFVNGQLNDDTPLGKLMHDFSCTDSEQMRDPVIAERFKKAIEEKKEMDAIQMHLHNIAHERGIEQGLRLGIEQGIERGIEQGIEQGLRQNRVSIVNHMKSMGLSEEAIIRYSGLAPEIVRGILAQSNDENADAQHMMTR